MGEPAFVGLSPACLRVNMGCSRYLSLTGTKTLVPSREITLSGGATVANPTLESHQLLPSEHFVVDADSTGRLGGGLGRADGRPTEQTERQ
jgi:hypothetical protein